MDTTHQTRGLKGPHHCSTESQCSTIKIWKLENVWKNECVDM